MQREIKFRVWDEESKSMFNVDTIDFERREVYFFDKEELYKSFIFREGELMQFTGLTDKNGVEIYEGDILKHRGHHRMEASVVVFSDGCFNIGYHYGSSTKVKPMLINSKVEIIGNIHKNPELLK